MYHKSLVSVIMGVYNAERDFLDTAIESVLTQTHKNLELIICDDGSTNDTALWIQQWQKRDPRIVFLQHETNQKLSSTLNHCLQIARGDFIARQDADDISHPTRLAKQLDFLAENPDIDFVGSSCALYPIKESSTTWERPLYPTKRDFLYNSPFIHGSLLFRRTCLNEDMCYHVGTLTTKMQDYELFMRMYAAGKRGANLQEPLYHYYYSDNQKRIKFQYRNNEFLLRLQGFKRMGILNPATLRWAFKPYAAYMMPIAARERLRKNHDARRKSHMAQHVS